MKRWLAWFWLGVVVVFTFLAMYTMWMQPSRLDTNILNLLPRQGHEHHLENQMASMLESISAEVVVLVGHSQTDTAALLADFVAKQLRQSGAFESVVYDDYADFEKNFYQVYFPARQGLLPVSLQKIFQDSAASAKLVQQNMGMLTSWMGGAVARLLPQDPLLLFPQWLISLKQKQGNIQYQNGALWLPTDSIHYVFIRGVLAVSPFQSSVQDAFHKAWEEIVQNANQITENSQLLSTGTLLFARQGRLAAQSEMSVIGTGSLVGILLLFLWLFRSIRHIVVGFLPVLAGLGVALAVGFWVFDSVHVLTLVMGMSLIGICVDYTFHYFAAHGMVTHSDSLKRILPGITMGMGTTLLAYAALACSGFPGLIQIAVLSGTGVLTSYVTVILWFPILMPQGTTPSPRLIQVGTWLSKWPSQMKKPLARWLFVLAMAGALIGIAFYLKTEDDIRMFQSMDSQLKETDRQIQQILGRFESNRFIWITGNNPEEVLQIQENVVESLIVAQRLGHIKSFHALSEFLPSQKRQRANHQSIHSWLQKPGEWNSYAQNLGLEDSLHYHLLNNDTILTLDKIQSSGLKHLLPPISKKDSTWMSPILLQGITQTHYLKTLDNKGSIRYVDRVENVSQVFTQFRKLAIRLLAFGNGIILLFLCWRYGLRQGIQAMFPPLASLVLTLGVLAWLGLPIQFFTILAFTLVLGAGVDYTLFLTEARYHEGADAWVAVSLSATTTILSFGLLALSQTAALAGFGLTVLCGCLFCFLLAPLGVSEASYE